MSGADSQANRATGKPCRISVICGGHSSLNCSSSGAVRAASPSCPVGSMGPSSKMSLG